MTDHDRLNAQGQQHPEPIVPPVVAQILAGRGMAPAEMAAFLYPDYGRHLHDPFLLTDMAPAVERIVAAVEAGERVVVYGDYDIDGVTASAVLIEALAVLGVAAESYIPDRFDEGYGINQEALERLQADGTQLVISVDCGITSVAEAQWARAHGLDLIITDHHAVPPEIPEAVAVINPKRPGDAYPFKELAGVGVAFKLVQALQQRTGLPAPGQEKWLLDLVALGTVGDVVPLVGENRVLVHYGLQVLRRGRRVGLRALAEGAGVEVPALSAYHLGYVLGPRINAAGRLEHAARSLELVRTDDVLRARSIARELETLNQRRRADQERIFEEADRLAAQYVDDPVLVLADPGWSHGVVGIVASKLVGKWQKPTLVAQVLGDHTKGSARSVGNFNMVEALRAQAPLLQRFGGHFFAAGYTLPTERLDDLRRGLNEHYLAQQTGAVETSARPAAELQFADLSAVDWELLGHLELLEPYGSGNPRPLVELAGVELAEVSRMGREGAHLRLRLQDGTGRRLAGVGFGLAERHGALGPRPGLTVRGHLNKNEFQGNVSIQIMIEELDYE
jgi:single-stranded-DNA-specific exonuclease